MMGGIWDHASKMYVKLLLFDSHGADFAQILDPKVTVNVNPSLKATLWSMVDYGAMCTSSGTIELIPTGDFLSDSSPLPPSLDFDLEFGATNGDQPLTGGRGSTGSEFSMSTVQAMMQ
ncbi:hypothetical protein G7Z17_g480 [Cylindrodendrum hubeiense]|uniref:Uncharacterized protein n=1 Tax=Cylindrodendrum hubeiense TaxID=595255 RepID=A0A9P5HMX4_9HYPO|nr:hypothetical protein G7Z17_g480 [Cylindrodendrum hubeiense]